MPASEKSALQCVMEVDQERIRLEKLVDELIACTDDGKFLVSLIVVKTYMMHFDIHTCVLYSMCNN